ncbi:cytochrome P450 [Nonomuraea sp. FMUSA5-5]|uniref:Cytochrome P450 n=1 Tax=Nonomuraea composti TaxID=2720023 RepID=A0ABX1AYL2_9ACTN|nr:cytochrome P450 [Nonomuraea sp. FMUSA5-5]NJP90698.1 cytochrome P450 [Nonomuraea sp. FMUSA5-5]
MADDPFPWPRTCPFAPPPQYAKLPPVSRHELASGQWAWLVAGHEEVRQVLRDPRVSSDRADPRFPVVFPAAQRALGRARAKPSYGGMDRPEHTLHRRMVAGEFTVRRVEALRPRIQEIVTEHIEALLAGPRPADLVAALALPVPSLVICELLGVPYEDREDFQRRTRMILSRTSGLEESVEAFVGLMAYLDRLVAAKRARPDGADLLGRLVARYVEAGVYDHEQLVSLASGLLIAGHETTANMISLGTVALLEHPAQLAELRRDPSLTRNAVEELLRLFSIADLVTARVATADLEVGGVTVRAGESVIALSAAADHDPAVFERPGELDVRRDARHHVAFGYGSHQCLGQNLARLELEIVFGTLFSRVPGLRVAVPVAELPFKTDGIMFGLHELPVFW